MNTPDQQRSQRALTARQTAGNEIAQKWSDAEVARYQEQHARGGCVFHVPSSVGATKGVVSTYVWGKTVCDTLHNCYTLLLGKPAGAGADPESWTEIDINTYAAIASATDANHTDLTLAGIAKRNDLAAESLVVTISGLSQCAAGTHVASGASQDEVSQVIGCSCPDWHHRHALPGGEAATRPGVLGDAFRGCKHMWALRTALCMHTPGDTA